MLDAIEKASEEAGGEVPDREAVIEQIFATEDYDGVLARPWSFDEDGDTTLTKLSVQRVEGGEFSRPRRRRLPAAVEMAPERGPVATGPRLTIGGRS